MGRLKSSTNKASTSRVITSTLSPSERVQFIANLIIDRIIKDQNNGKPLLKKLSIEQV